jgi:hypothetical protein
MKINDLTSLALFGQKKTPVPRPQTAFSAGKPLTDRLSNALQNSG